MVFLLQSQSSSNLLHNFALAGRICERASPLRTAALCRFGQKAGVPVTIATGTPHYFAKAAAQVTAAKPHYYQMITLSSGVLYILSPSFTSKALKKLSRFLTATFTRLTPSECGSVLVRRNISSFVMLAAQTFA